MPETAAMMRNVSEGAGDAPGQGDSPQALIWYYDSFLGKRLLGVVKIFLVQCELLVSIRVLLSLGVNLVWPATISSLSKVPPPMS